MIRIATNKVREEARKHPEWDLRMLATVHDENVYEVKKQYADEAAKRIKEVFESAVTLSVPVLASVGRGKNYAEAK
jgi:DNA polymerase-1